MGAASKGMGWLGWVIVAALTVFAFLVLGPSNVGGPVTYVTTQGNSMEPKIHQGDLLLARRQSSYKTGDVVAYRSKTLKNQVTLHRIVSQDGASFTTKGDHNGWLDPDHPTAQDILGKQWLLVPGGAKILNFIKSPIGLVLVGATLLLLNMGFRKQKARRAVHGGPDPTPGGRLPPSRILIPAGATAAGIGVVLGMLAFARPDSTKTTVTTPYTAKLDVTYSGTAPPSIVYPGGKINSGDPLYTKLLKSLHVQMAYSVNGVDAIDVTGDAWIDRQLIDATGWKSPVDSTRHQSLTVTGASMETDVPVHALLGTLSRIGSLTGAGGSGFYQLTGHVRVAGSVGGRPFTNDFSAPVKIELGATQTTFDGNLSTTQDGTVENPGMQPNSMALGPVKFNVGTGRTVAALLFLGGAATLGLGLRKRKTEVKPDEITILLAKYKRHLVPATSAGVPPGQPFVDVADLPDLVRLAERHEEYVLHLVGQNGQHVFVLPMPNCMYRYCYVPGVAKTPKGATPWAPGPPPPAATTAPGGGSGGPAAATLPQPRPGGDGEHSTGRSTAGSADRTDPCQP